MEFEKAIEYRDLLAQRQTGLTAARRSRAETARIRTCWHWRLRMRTIPYLRRMQSYRSSLSADGKLIGREHFYLRIAPQDERRRIILNSFIKQFYAGTPFVPRELMMRGRESRMREVVETWLTQTPRTEGHGSRAKKGHKRKTGRDWRGKNAEIVLRQDTRPHQARGRPDDRRRARDRRTGSGLRAHRAHGSVSISPISADLSPSDR